MVLFCKPRVCGEKSPSPAPCTRATGSPPRMRGKVVAHCVRQNAVRITPAYAGKRPGNVSGAHNVWDHPRMCGEKALQTLLAVGLLGSPPHVRGKADVLDFLQFGFGITPACAGKRQNTGCKAVNQRDHPRMCGEKASFVLVVWSRAGSPPHVRGKALLRQCRNCRIGITPACAGKRRIRL